ncbi:hypothetical protein H4683_002054 [Filibacter limicola]|uniref:Uncharacterized protein n=1 Tax=Sporosarcina limicola TaxID=34101 RepID=A0A927RD26_9BACL|nr:hypothetical protein [Sporosarcina limicola]
MSAFRTLIFRGIYLRNSPIAASGVYEVRSRTIRMKKICTTSNPELISSKRILVVARAIAQTIMQSQNNYKKAFLYNRKAVNIN